MALKVWLPLNGSLENKGISGIIVTNNGATVDNNGKIGKCYSFDGVDDRIYANNVSISNQEMSACCWVKFNNLTNNNYPYIFALGSNVSGTNIQLGLAYWKTDGKLHLVGHGSETASTYTPVLNTWIHLCITIKGNQTLLYVNGILNSTITNANSPKTQTCLCIGARSNSTAGAGTAISYPMNCCLNDFRIYDHCLSLLEVKEISQGLILHYKLDGFSGGSGRNLLRKPTTSTGYGARNELTTLTFSGWDKYADLDLVNMDWNNQVGKKLTYRCWLENIEQTAGTGTGIMLHVIYADGTYQQYGGGKNGTNGSYLSQGETGWVYLTITIPNPATRSNPTTITKIQASIRHNSSTGVSTVKYKNSQVELGDYPTSFGFAPEDLGIDTTKIIDSSGYGNNGFLVNGTNETVGINNSRYQVCTNLLGTTVDSTSNTITGAQYLYTPFKMPAWAAITVAWWGNNIAYGRGGIFETTGTTGNIWEGSDYNTTAIANWDSTFGIFNGTTRINIFNNFIKDSTWHHHAITFDGANVKYYCDSVLKQTSALTGTLPAITGFKMGLGKAGGAYRQIKQKLNDLRIYTTALSAEDIATLYHTLAQIDNLGGIHGFEMVEKQGNILSNVNIAITGALDKNLSGVGTYTQANCTVIYENNAIRIYRPPNITHNSSSMHNMWGGMRLRNSSVNSYHEYNENTDNIFGLQKNHTYVIYFTVKGQSSNAATSVGWTNQMGWGGGGLTPNPTNIEYLYTPVNFNGEMQCFYKFTISDDVVKTCTTAYSYATVGKQYLSYNDFMYGFGYENTGSLGTDVYVNNFRMFDITSLDNKNITLNGIVNFLSFNEENDDIAHIHKFGEMQVMNIIEK